MNKKLFLSLFLSIVLGIILALVRTGSAIISPFPGFYWILFASLAMLLALSCTLFKSGKATYSVKSDAQSVSIYEKSFTGATRFIAVLAAFITLFSAAAYFITDSPKRLLTAVITIFIVLCSLSMVLRIKDYDRSVRCGIFSLFPVYFTCIYLLVFYRGNAKVPDFNFFAPEAITIISLIFTVYLGSAAKFGKNKPTFRAFVTLSYVCLTIFEFMSYIISPETLLCTTPVFFLPLLAGFAIYYFMSLCLPDMILYSTK